MSIPKASLNFSAYAWAKLQFFLNATNSEVGMMGISSLENPLTIIDLAILPQEVTTASIEFSEEGIANFYDDCIDLKMNPIQYSRVWIHTHPTGIYSPSSVDEKTFSDIFGKCDWAVMYILTKDNRDYCALQFNRFPQHRVELTGTRVDFSIPFQNSNKELWEKELKDNVKKKEIIVKKFNKKENKQNGYGYYGSRINPLDKWTEHYFNKENDEKNLMNDFLKDDFFEEDFYEDDFFTGDYGEVVSYTAKPKKGI